MIKRKQFLQLFCLFLFANGQAQVSKTINITIPGSLNTILTARYRRFAISVITN